MASSSSTATPQRKRSRVRQAREAPAPPAEPSPLARLARVFAEEMASLHRSLETIHANGFVETSGDGISRLARELAVERTRGLTRALRRASRAPADDESAMLVDAFAAAADVLAQYQELLAEEAYLGTSKERRPILRESKALAALAERAERAGGKGRARARSRRRRRPED